MAFHLPHDTANIPVSIIIIAQNEEKNIAGCLDSLVNNFDDIWLVDSFSEDKTAQIAQKYGVNIIILIKLLFIFSHINTSEPISLDIATF